MAHLVKYKVLFSEVLIITMVSTEKFYLRWDNFESNISSAFRDLKEDKDFSDVTLACSDQQVEAHKVILAASSNFFKKVLKNIKHSHPLIYMKGVKFTDLEAVLSFLYRGEVNVAEADLNNFLTLGEELEVKGLRSNRNHSESSSCHQFQSDSHQKPQSNSQHGTADAVPTLVQSASQVPLQNLSETQLNCGNGWLAYANNNDGGTVNVKMEPESSQPVPVEEADHYAGHKEFNQEKRDGGVNEEKGEGFDLNNYIEKISDGANIGKFQCNICGYVASVYNVKRHVESKHFPGVFEYSCDQCEENFNTKSKLQNHRNYYHSSNSKRPKKTIPT